MVRGDRNTSDQGSEPQVIEGVSMQHLGDGCVTAFALTSALAQSEGPLSSAAQAFVDVLGHGEMSLGGLTVILLPALPFVPRALGDLLLYSVARNGLDKALDDGTIKPFP